MSLRLLWSLLSLLLAFSLSCPAHADSKQAAPEELFRAGREAVEKKDWQRARELLGKSWARKKSFDTAALLGQTELKLEKYREAAEHLDYATRNFPNIEPTPDARKRIEEAFQSAREKVVALTIVVDVTGAEITIDGTAVGRSPLESEAFLDPGRHVVVAKAEGYQPAEEALTAPAGQAAKVSLRLTKAAAESPGAQAPASTPGEHSAPPVAPQKKSMVPALVAGGVGLVGLAAGVGLFVASKSKSSERDDRLGDLPGTNPCGAGTKFPEKCDEIRSLDDDANRFRVLSYVGFGVAVAGGVGAFLLWPREAKRETGLAITPSFGTRGTSLVVSGAF